MQQVLIFGLFANWSFTAAIRFAQKSDADCEAITPANCQSAFEIIQDGKCVLAHKIPQYTMGSSSWETIANFETMMLEYYKDRSILENMINVSDKGHRMLVEKMGRALLHTKKFVVGALGSSITAGHDNCNVDSYVSQLYHLLAPVFDQAGINFQSRNGGVGGACGDLYVDQVYCMERIVGSDIDIAHYNWDYFDRDQNNTFHEDFIRLSLSMPNEPMPMIWTLARTHLRSHDSLYSTYGDLGYHALAATASNPPEVPDKDAEPEDKFGFVGDGEHKWTRLADRLPEGSCRRKSTGVLWRNWHGGPMLYQRISDALGWMYVGALKSALKEIHHGATFAKKEPLTLPKSPQSRLSTSPKCLSFNSPSYAEAGDRQIKVIKEKSTKGTLTLDDHRKDLLPEEEGREAFCSHLDRCGAMAADRLTFDLHANNNIPLDQGVLVLCIGGGPPSDLEGFHKVFSTNTLQFGLPETAVFPRCASGTVSSLKVDGKSYDVSKAKHWKHGAETAVKCGSFPLHKKDAREVTVEGACSVTHLFAF